MQHSLCKYKRILLRRIAGVMVLPYSDPRPLGLSVAGKRPLVNGLLSDPAGFDSFSSWQFEVYLVYASR